MNRDTPGADEAFRGGVGAWLRNCVVKQDCVFAHPHENVQDRMMPVRLCPSSRKDPRSC